MLFLQPLLIDLKVLENGVQMVLFKNLNHFMLLWLCGQGITRKSPNFACHKILLLVFAVISVIIQRMINRLVVVSMTFMQYSGCHSADCSRLIADASSGKDTGFYRTCCLSEILYFSLPDNI